MFILYLLFAICLACSNMTSKMAGYVLVRLCKNCAANNSFLLSECHLHVVSLRASEYACARICARYAPGCACARYAPGCVPDMRQDVRQICARLCTRYAPGCAPDMRQDVQAPDMRQDVRQPGYACASLWAYGCLAISVFSQVSSCLRVCSFRCSFYLIV